MFRLRVEGGTRSGEVMALPPGGRPVVIGRGREADLRFPEDATMSRAQVELAWDGKDWVLKNKSQHGTLIGGGRVDADRKLVPGDVLTLGGTKLVFESDPAGIATLPPGAKAPGGAANPAAAPAPAPAAAPVSTGANPSTPQPAPRPGTPAPAGGPGASPAPGAPTPAAPGAKKKGSMVPIVIVGLLFLCCCFSGVGYVFVYPRYLYWKNGGNRRD